MLTLQSKLLHSLLHNAFFKRKSFSESIPLTLSSYPHRIKMAPEGQEDNEWRSRKVYSSAQVSIALRIIQWVIVNGCRHFKGNFDVRERQITPSTLLSTLPNTPWHSSHTYTYMFMYLLATDALEPLYRRVIKYWMNCKTNDCREVYKPLEYVNISDSLLSVFICFTGGHGVFVLFHLLDSLRIQPTLTVLFEIILHVK